MDPFEKEYFDKIGKIAGDFKSRRRELAKSRIKMFVYALCRQQVEFNESYDLLIGAGNSGLFMTKIAEKMYEYLDIKTPKILNLPIFRFREDNKSINDNSSLLPQVDKELQNISNIKNILFVDDEIMRALTARACFELIVGAGKHKQCIEATIIAEDHFFEWHYKIPDVSIRFFSYSRLIQGLNGNIGHFIPESFYKLIVETNKDLESYNRIMAVVVGGALKRRDSDKQYFDYTVEYNLREKVHDYENKKTLLKYELQELVRESVEVYKAGSVWFRI